MDLPRFQGVLGSFYLALHCPGFDSLDRLPPSESGCCAHYSRVDGWCPVVPLIVEVDFAILDFVAVFLAASWLVPPFGVGV